MTTKKETIAYLEDMIEVERHLATLTVGKMNRHHRRNAKVLEKTYKEVTGSPYHPFQYRNERFK